MNHPLALSAEYKARLQAQGLIVIRKDPEHIENVVKDATHPANPHALA